MSDNTTASADAGMKPAACDQCRSRKIKCDRNVPCANCRAFKRSCSSTGPGQKFSGSRQRVLISTRYEQKIDTIEHRLGGIERLLQDVISAMRNGEPNQLGALRNASQDADNLSKTTIIVTDEPTPIFEGGSSLTAHTNFASNLISDNVQQADLAGLASDFQSALSALRDIVEGQGKRANGNEVAFSNQKPTPKGGFRQLPMPPAQLVLDVLQEMKENGPSVPFALHCIFLPVEDFAEYCHRVYFGAEEYDISTFIVVNGGLFYALGGRPLIPEEEDNPNRRAGHLRYRDICAENLSATLSELSIFLPASPMNIEALLLGSNYAIEASRPSLAWRMNSLAAQMCQTLGYHRGSPPPGTAQDLKDQQRKADTFRYTYMINKALALRLGRVSAFQDYDISIPIYPNRGEGDNLWRRVISIRVRHAHVQGRIYDQLYSSEAQLVSLEQKVQRAMALAETIKAIAREADSMKMQVANLVEKGGQPPPRQNMNGWKLILTSEMVTYHSTLTLIYRAIQQHSEASSAFAYECHESARLALQYHMDCMHHGSLSPIVQAGYIHWTLLFAPFTPLTATFCHAIERLDADNLRQLEAFISSLESVVQQSEAIEQLHRLAQVLQSIASLYIQAKRSHMAQQQDAPPFERDFEVYLNRLGLMKPGMEPAVLQNSSPAGGSAQNEQHWSWYTGNLTMMSLLDQDVPGFFR